MVYRDKTGKKIDLFPGAEFLATDRQGRTFRYFCTGRFSYYELILLNLDEPLECEYNETRVTSSWFAEREIEMCN